MTAANGCTELLKNFLHLNMEFMFRCYTLVENKICGEHISAQRKLP